MNGVRVSDGATGQVTEFRSVVEYEGELSFAFRVEAIGDSWLVSTCKDLNEPIFSLIVSIYSFEPLTLYVESFTSLMGTRPELAKRANNAELSVLRKLPTHLFLALTPAVCTLFTTPPQLVRLYPQSLRTQPTPDKPANRDYLIHYYQEVLGFVPDDQDHLVTFPRVLEQRADYHFAHHVTTGQRELVRSFLEQLVPLTTEVNLEHEAEVRVHPTYAPRTQGRHAQRVSNLAFRLWQDRHLL